MKILTSLCRVLVGALFIFSGFIKSNDPKGTAIKLNEYFEKFSEEFEQAQDSVLIDVMDNYGTSEHYTYTLAGTDSFKYIQVNQSALARRGFANEEGGTDTFTGSDLFVVYNDNKLYNEFYSLEDSIDIPKVRVVFRMGSGKVLLDKTYALTMNSHYQESEKLEVYSYVKQQSFLVGFFTWLKGFSIYFSIIMCVLEVALGFAILIGWQSRFVMWVTLLLIIFFTFLTGYTYFAGYCTRSPFGIISLVLLILTVVSAVVIESKKGRYLGYFTLASLLVFTYLCIYTNVFFGCEFTPDKMKVKDCGCFGDFIKLKPYESFFKDLVLSVLILFLFIRRKHIVPLFSPLFGLNAVLVVTIASTVFTIYCNMFLPVFDHLPYKKGNNIREMLTPPPGADPVDKYKSILVYEKNGKRDSFTIENYPKDTTWKFVTTVNVLIKEGWKSKIKDFRFIKRDENDIDLADTFVHGKGYYIMVVSTHIEDAHQSSWEYIKTLADEAARHHVSVYGVTSSSLDYADAFVAGRQLKFMFRNADETMLKTIVRSNPGVLMWHDGKIINKWSCRGIPTIQKIMKLISKNP